MMEGKSVSSCPTAGIVTFHKSRSVTGGLPSSLRYVPASSGLWLRDFLWTMESPYEARMKSDAVFRYGTFRERLAAFVKKACTIQEEFQKRAFEFSSGASGDTSILRQCR